MVLTTLGKEAALAGLAQRRLANRSLVHVDNSSLYAGEPMYFYCLGCGAEIVVPESWITKPDCCPECTALKKLGWLE